MFDPHAAGERFGGKIAQERGPRAVGIFGVLVGASFIGLNVLSVRLTGYSWTMLLLGGMIVLPLGAWVLVTGRTVHSPNNPAWWTVGYHVVGVSAFSCWLYLCFVRRWLEG